MLLKQALECDIAYWAIYCWCTYDLFHLMWHYGLLFDPIFVRLPAQILFLLLAEKAKTFPKSSANNYSHLHLYLLILARIQTLDSKFCVGLWSKYKQQFLSYHQRIFTYSGSITAWLTSCLNGFIQPIK